MPKQQSASTAGCPHTHGLGGRAHGAHGAPAVECLVMETLLALTKLFILRPDRIAIAGASFVVLAMWIYYVRRHVAWPALLTAGIWFAFAAWEAYVKAVKANIRVDLFVIWPFLFVATALGIFWSLKQLAIAPDATGSQPVNSDDGGCK